MLKTAQDILKRIPNSVESLLDTEGDGENLLTIEKIMSSKSWLKLLNKNLNEKGYFYLIAIFYKVFVFCNFIQIETISLLATVCV